MGVVTTFFPIVVFVVYHARLHLTVNFHHGQFFDPTNRPWVSEDGFDESRCLVFFAESALYADFVKQPKNDTCFRE